MLLIASGINAAAGLLPSATLLAMLLIVGWGFGLAAYTLQSAGHEVRTAIDASGALREISLFRPEAVVLDISLPDQTGLDVCAAIRTGSRVPVLFVTGRATIQDKTRGFRSGGDDY